MYILKKGSDCRLSESGHNNFYYPSKTRAVRVASDADVTRMSWVSYNSNLIPVKIKNSDLLLENMDLFDKDYSVVWVLKEDLVQGVR